MKNNISILQNWFLSNCDGDWEHEYGVKIETIDNPGWSINIELHRTPLEGLYFNKTKLKVEGQWYEAIVEDNVFKAFGSDLSDLISVFYNEFLMPNLEISEFTYSIYAKIPNVFPDVWRVITAKMKDITLFEIIEINELKWEMLKVKEVKDFEKLNFANIPIFLNYQKGDIVKCCLIEMFDYPTLIIDEDSAASAGCSQSYPKAGSCS